jgi:hypothetical protein
MQHSQISDQNNATQSLEARVVALGLRHGDTQILQRRLLEVVESHFEREPLSLRGHSTFFRSVPVPGSESAKQKQRIQ